MVEDEAGKPSTLLAPDLRAIPRTELDARGTDAEVLFRSAVDTVGLGVWIHDLNTGRIRSTPQMRALAGFPPHAEVPSIEPWGDRIHPDDLPGLTEQYRVLLSTGPPDGEVTYHSAYRNRLPQGRTVHVDWFGRVLYDKAGAPFRVIGTALDATERVLAAQAARQRESDLAEAQRLARIVEWSYDPVAGARFSAELLELLGVDRGAPFTLADFEARMDAQHREQLRALLAGDHPAGVYLRLRAGGGRTLAVSALASPAADGRLRCVLQDVTEQQQISEALRASEENHRKLVEVTPDGILVHEGGIITLANPAAVRLFGASSADDLLGTSIDDRVAPEFREVARHRSEAIQRLGVSSPLMLQRWLRLNGSPLDLEVTGARLRRGDRPAVQVVLRDVGERRRAELLLREREAFFRTLIEHSLDVILLVDEQLAMTYASPAITTVLGLQAEEPVGRPFLDLIHPDDRQRAALELRGLVAVADGVTVLQLRLQHASGGFREVEASLSNRTGDPSVRAVVVNFRDMTERRALEQQFRQAQKMEAMGRMAGGVAHDFNNLLCIILTCSELALGRIGPDEQLRADLSDVVGAAERAATLTRQLLAYSRKQLMQPVVLHLNAVVEEMSSLLQRLLGEEVRLELELGDEVEPVRADRGQLEQVIVNLAVNARDAMPAGGILRVGTARLRLDEAQARERGLQAGDWSVLSVSDQGQGMSAEVQAHLFEPFFTTKQVGKGTGLGLATVQGIVQQSGGVIEVESAPGEGSTFLVCLPVAAGPSVAQHPPPPAATQIGGSETVLLVEDSTALRQLLLRRFRELGYDAHAAASGPEALAWLSTRPAPIDALLTDAVMPGMSGPELIGHVRRHSPNAQTLLVSGYLEVEGVDGVIASGTAYLPKPFTPDRAAARLREMLNEARGRAV